MRSFVPAIYDVTVAIPKTQPSPTMLRIFNRQPSVVRNIDLLFFFFFGWVMVWLSKNSLNRKMECTCTTKDSRLKLHIAIMGKSPLLLMKCYRIPLDFMYIIFITTIQLAPSLVCNIPSVSCLKLFFSL